MIADMFLWKYTGKNKEFYKSLKSKIKKEKIVD